MSETHDAARSPESDSLDAKLDRVDTLVSALVDDVISDEEVKELEQLLQGCSDARTRYAQGMQLHTDLIEHFSPVDPKEVVRKSPVLGFLAGDPEDSGVALPPAKPVDPA